MDYIIKSIGIVKSPVTEGVDHNWGEVTSEIELEEQYTDGLEGLDKFTHVIVVFYLHQASFVAGTDLKRRPQGREDMPMVGIFAQRAKHRPNPIGLTTVEIVGVQQNKVIVKGLDAIDGTPVLDIKPYYPVYDMKNGSQTPEWVDILMKDYF